MSLKRTGLKRGLASPFVAVSGKGSRGIAHLASADEHWRRQPGACQELAKFLGVALVLGEDGIEQRQAPISLAGVARQKAQAGALAAQPMERITPDRGRGRRQILRLDSAEPGRVAEAPGPSSGIRRECDQVDDGRLADG